MENINKLDKCPGHRFMTLNLVVCHRKYTNYLPCIFITKNGPQFVIIVPPSTIGYLDQESCEDFP